MIRDLAQGSPGEVSADACIVGSGPAGLAVAQVLAEKGREVVVLESGGFTPEEGPQALNHGGKTGILDDLTGSRPRIFGGASQVWAGHCGALDPDDFVEETWSGSLGWPIDPSALTPHYRDAFRFLGMDPAFADAPDASGDPVPPPPAGLQPRYIVRHPVRLGERRSEWVSEGEGVTLWLHATAVDTIPRGRRVDRITASSLNGESLTVRAPVFVLAAGGVENPRLLLSWAEQGGLPAEGAAAENIGCHFCIHPHLDHGALLLTGEAAEDPFHVTHRMAAGVTRSTAYQIAPDLRREMGLIKVLFRHEDRPEDNDEAVAAERALGAWHGRRTQLQERLFLQASMPMSRANRISLGAELDRLGMRRVQVSVTWAPAVFENYRRSLGMYVRAMGEAGYGRVRYDLDTFDDYVAGRRVPWGGHHFMCATRMGRGPTDGVVDAHLRLFGCDNLYVVGASAFGAPGAINPTLTLTALAFRLGRHIAGIS